MAVGGSLTISAAEETLGAGNNRLKLKPGRYVRLLVADTGIGMDEVTLARAIEPFFSTRGIGKETGLGLSMMHGLAAQLGGALETRSTPGLGTSIDLHPPVARKPLSNDRRTLRSTRLRERDARSSSTMRSWCGPAPPTCCPTSVSM